ncbi:hypothetical protein [Terasakiella sp.]|uniref:hypothetical protein n=1 Tax=Terasakiella sp. TaxID=2034861 RepID=UPI003AA7FD71
MITIDSHGNHERVVKHLADCTLSHRHSWWGMCSGVRIVNYIKAMLGDKRHNVLFLGYQANGSPGHVIQAYGPKAAMWIWTASASISAPAYQRRRLFHPQESGAGSCDQNTFNIKRLGI